MATKTLAPSAKAKEAYVRISASKVRVVLNLVRGKSVAEAKDILELTERKAASYIDHCLNSAINNAEQRSIDAEELFISECFADEGVTLRRWRARARGSATRIRKRTSTITIFVSRYTPEEMDQRRERGKSQKSVESDARSKRVQASKGTAAEDTEEVTEENPPEETETPVEEVTEAPEEEKPEEETPEKEEIAEEKPTEEKEKE